MNLLRHPPQNAGTLSQCIPARSGGQTGGGASGSRPGSAERSAGGSAGQSDQESWERVRSALRNSGFRGPLVRAVINLAPADLRKEGPSFDLPIALALLVASGQLARPQLEGLWCAGELGLDGSLRPCRGVIALAEKVHQQKARALVVPPENAHEASLIEGASDPHSTQPARVG